MRGTEHKTQQFLNLSSVQNIKVTEAAQSALTASVACSRCIPYPSALFARQQPCVSPHNTSFTHTCSTSMNRPSNAHIMVSDKEAAAAWGTACSVWPLGDTLDFSWLENCSEWWVRLPQASERHVKRRIKLVICTSQSSCSCLHVLPAVCCFEDASQSRVPPVP